MNTIVYKRRKNTILMGWAITVIIILLTLGGLSYISYTGMSGTFEGMRILEVYATNACLYLWLIPAGAFALIILFLTVYSLGSKKILFVEDDILRFDGRNIDFRSEKFKAGQWYIQHAGNVGSIFYFNNEGEDVSMASFGVKLQEDLYNAPPAAKFDYSINDPTDAQKFADLVMEKSIKSATQQKTQYFTLEGSYRGWSQLMIMWLFYGGAGLLSLLGYIIFNSGISKNYAIALFIIGVNVFILGMVTLGNIMMQRKGLRLILSEDEIRAVDSVQGKEKWRLPIFSCNPKGVIWKKWQVLGLALVLNVDGKEVVIGSKNNNSHWSMNEGFVWRVRYLLDPKEFKRLTEALSMANRLIETDDYASKSEKNF